MAFINIEDIFGELLMPIKLALIDDHPVIRHAIKHSLSNVQLYEVVGESNTGKKGLALIKEVDPEIVLLDFHLPDISGLEVCRQIHLRKPNIKVLFITAEENLSVLARVMNSSANGIISKGSHFSLIDALNAVYTGRYYIQPELIHSIMDYMKEQHMFEQLSDREYEIFLMSINGRSCIEIAHSLMISPRTTANHRSKVMQKLGIQNWGEGIALFQKTAPRHDDQ